MQNVAIAELQAMFETCPDPTVVVEGEVLIARNAAFLAFFGDATSLLACLDPRDHAAVNTAPTAKRATFTARTTLGEGAGTPMRWTAWPIGDRKTCVRLDGPATPVTERDPKLAPLAPALRDDEPATPLARLLATMFEQMDAIFFAVDKAGTILVSEGKGLAHFGLKRGQVVGRNAFQLYASDSTGQINTRRALDGESLRTTTMEGASHFITFYEPVGGAQGDVSGALGLSICIDENAKEMLEARALLGAIEQLPVAIWAMERDGTCILSRGKGLQDLGLESDGIVGKNLFEVYADHPTFASDMGRVFAGQQVLAEAQIGDMYWRNHFVPVRGILGEEVQRVYAVAENVTERTQNERRLQDQLALIQSQKHSIAGLSSPIIEVWQGVLVVPVIGVLDEDRAGRLLERLLMEVVTRQASSVILDLTGVDVVESATAPHLFNILRSVELLGASGLVSGIRPNVARTMVELDINLSARHTYPTLAEALRRLIGARAGASPKR